MLSHIPLNKDELLDAGFDYVALGHLHNPQVYIRNLAVYAGAPEPVCAEDTGEHGYVLGEVQRKKVHISFVEMEGRRYLEKTVEVTESDILILCRKKSAVSLPGTVRRTCTALHSPEREIPDLCRRCANI